MSGVTKRCKKWIGKERRDGQIEGWKNAGRLPSVTKQFRRGRLNQGDMKDGKGIGKEDKSKRKKLNEGRNEMMKREKQEHQSN